MKVQSLLQEQINALSALMAEILGNPETSPNLKNHLEIFLAICRESLSQEAERDIEVLEMKVLLPEVLSRLE